VEIAVEIGAGWLIRDHRCHLMRTQSAADERLHF